MARRRYKSGPKKGQFMSNRAIAAARNSGKKKKTKALVRRGKTTMAKKKNKSRKRGRGGYRGRGGIPMGEVKELMMGGAIYGYITETDSGEESEIRATVTTTLAKMPNIGNRDISNGIALYLIDKHIYSNKYVRMTAKAALVSGAVRFGRRGMKLGGVEDDELAGWGDALDVTEQGEVVSGVID